MQLDDDQRRRAADILLRNLATFDVWIVENLTIQTLAGLARRDPPLREELVPVLRRYEHSKHKSVANRVRKLLAEFAG